MPHWVLAAALCALAGAVSNVAETSPWGASYFPNVSLTTDEGKTVRFFDDLIEDKIVAVNFIYTRCPDVCPLETAQLVRVQDILGERLGEEVHFYSISINPENDSPAVLADYKKRFGARWMFLTGEASDITQLRKKLGLYVAEIQDGSNNHNLNMIIGNQASGRWMKRSPFENPYVLADQLGNWLNDWRSPQRGQDYAKAPKLRDVSRGEQLFRTRCAACHSLDGNEPENALGPDLLGVTLRREPAWLLNWLRAPDEMLRAEDPIALALYERYDRLAMPNMSLNRQESLDLIEFMDQERRRFEANARNAGSAETESRTRKSDVVAVMNAWVREAHPAATVNAGYMDLLNVGSAEVTLLGVESPQFERVEIHEMAIADGLSSMREITELLIPANSQIRLEPGGKHLMLIGPKQPLTAGRKVDLNLRFASGRQQSLTTRVSAAGVALR